MVSLRYQLEAFAKEDEEVEAGIQDRILLTIHYDDKPAAKLENTIVKAKGTNSYSRHKELTNKKVVRYTMDEILQEGDEFHRTGKGKHGVFIWKNKALLNSQQNQSYKSFADALKQQQVEEGTDISLNAWKAFLIKRDGKLYKLDDIFIK